MSYQTSIVHRYFPLNLQVLEKNFLRDCCSLSENKTQNYFRKDQFCSHNIYMSN